jgi:hypothetical protein
MKEELLHIVWKHLLFETRFLKTTQSENVVVHKVGMYNSSHAGPDFQQASISIDNIQWNGAVEIHIKSSDWNLHQHQKDAAYDAVILHVVYEDNQPVRRIDGSLIPCLELKKYVSQDWLQRAESILLFQDSLPCKNHLHEMSSLTITSIKERMLANRIERKGRQLLDFAQENPQPFQWKLHAVVQSFSMGLNAELFHRMVKDLTPALFNKLVCSPVGVEAFLFGAAGMLEEESNDEYFLRLKKEFEFIKKAYGFIKRVDASEWKFLRTRPANFPSLRIAQLASFLKQLGIMDRLEEKFLFTEIEQLFEIQLPNYWHTHYRFGETFQTLKIKTFSKSFVNHFIINSMIPLWSAYYFYFNDEKYYHQLWKWYERLPAEPIAALNVWKESGVPVQNAFDSQALLELNSSLCSQKKCLSCTIGIKILQANYTHARN